jgi:hypothetical protein
MDGSRSDEGILIGGSLFVGVSRLVGEVVPVAFASLDCN